tara:strand:+ start:838 stop:1011 length:174 start_codon:yes stop_codon:yes gene_type:complete
MLSTLENKSKKTFGRAGLLGLGAGLYLALSEIVILSSVVVFVYLGDAFLTWRENKEV